MSFVYRRQGGHAGLRGKVLPQEGGSVCNVCDYIFRID